MIKEYFDEIRCKILNALEKIQFNGTDIVTPAATYGRGLQIKNVADPTDDQDVVTKKYLQDNGAGGVATVNDISPTVGNVNISFDSVAKKGSASTVHVSVPADAYGAGWANSQQVPTKGDVYLEMEKKSNSAVGGRYAISLPSAGTVAGRISAAIPGTDYPVGWTLSPDINFADLIIIHGLSARVMQVSIFAVDGNVEQQLFNTAAYNGIKSLDDNTILIQSLATIQKRIKIYFTVV